MKDKILNAFCDAAKDATGESSGVLLYLLIELLEEQHETLKAIDGYKRYMLECTIKKIESCVYEFENWKNVQVAKPTSEGDEDV